MFTFSIGEQQWMAILVPSTAIGGVDKSMHPIVYQIFRYHLQGPEELHQFDIDPSRANDHVPHLTPGWYRPDEYGGVAMPTGTTAEIQQYLRAHENSLFSRLRVYRTREIDDDDSESKSFIEDMCPAALGGDARARTAIAFHHESTTGNLTAALVWYFLAQKSGDETTRERIDAISPLMTPEQIASAKAQAGSWSPSQGCDAPH
jgi:hypothetical protein